MKNARHGGSLSLNVKELIENIYREASSAIRSNLAISLAMVHPSEVDKAEAILLHIQQLIKGDFEPSYRFVGTRL